MAEIYLQGNGVPCYKPSTGGFYLWSEACCEDCTACVERKDRGAGNANAPYGYKCEVFDINAWAGEPAEEDCSQSNCVLYNLSYVMQANPNNPPGPCNYVKGKAGGIEPHVPDACSVADANSRYIAIAMTYVTDGVITVTYHWGGPGGVPSGGTEIIYTKTYSGTRIPCLELTAEKIDYVSHTWGTTTYCDPTSSYCELTDL